MIYAKRQLRPFTIPNFVAVVSPPRERQDGFRPAGPKCKRCGDTGWLDGDPVRGISGEPCGCDENWEE